MTTFAMFVPAGTPSEVIARLNREVNKALETPEVKKWLLGQGIASVGGPPADLDAHQRSDSAKWGRIIKEQGIKFE
jgi:tripartite-type tricarboxylate transporter receptor subunit TctC